MKVKEHFPAGFIKTGFKLFIKFKSMTFYTLF